MLPLLARIDAIALRREAAMAEEAIDGLWKVKGRFGGLSEESLGYRIQQFPHRSASPTWIYGRARNRSLVRLLSLIRFTTPCACTL